jgi:hypothetical protein
MTTRTRPLAAALGPHRLVAATLPRGEAVRVAQGRSAAGRLLWRARIGEPPAQVTCAEVEGSSAQVVAFHVRTDEARAGVVVARGGRQRLLAADGPGSELCTGLAGADGLDCSTPPVDTELTVLERGGRVLHGVLARDVASVELRLRDGRTRRVATTAGRAYHGRYAGHVRFLVAPLPPGAYVRRAIARDARGRSLGRVFIEGSQSTDRVPVVPGLELERTRYTTEGRTTTSVCVLPRSAQSLIGRLGVCGLGFSSATIVGSVTCAPRRTRLFGTLPRGATGVRVGRYTPVVVRLPGIGRVWLITLPARAGVRSLRYLGHLRTNRFGLTPDARHPLRIPPATRQCGYDLRQDVG